MGANGTSSNAPVVIVDDRQPESDVRRLKEYGLAAVQGRLDAGDFEIFPHGMAVGIEVKTVSELLQSMASKRLVDQLQRMVDTYHISILLRRGEFRRDPTGKLAYRAPTHPEADGEGWVTSGWDWNSWQGIMFDISIVLDVKLWDCPISSEYPQEVARLTQSLSNDNHKWIKERQRPEVVAIDKQYRDVVWSLCAFQGMGPETVEALVGWAGSYYKAIDEVISAPQVVADELRVNGKRVSLKKIEKLREQMLEEWK